ncbi:hypothetical protein EDC04DRAFT_3136193 [Pisolithus marmoratus]|nr:hypothetical protein EDC04DRAFT_3136193 [Pisolithus marmoratus]
MNGNATLSSSYTTGPLQLYAIGSSIYLHENEIISTYGDLGHGCAGPAIGLGSLPSIHGHTSDQVFDSTAPSSGPSSPPLPSVQEQRPSDGLNNDYVPLPPGQIRTDMTTANQPLSVQTIRQTHPHTPFPYSYPTPSESDSTSNTDNYMSSNPSFLMPKQSPVSQSPQEHIGSPFPVHPQHTIPAGLPDFHGFRVESKMELYTTRTAHTPSDLDHPSPTPSDHGEQPFGNHATYILDDHTATTISGGRRLTPTIIATSKPTLDVTPWALSAPPHSWSKPFRDKSSYTSFVRLPVTNLEETAQSTFGL